MGERLRDLDQLLVTDRQVTDQFVGIDIDIELFENRGRFPHHCFLVDDQAFPNGSAEKDVFRDGEFTHEVEFLVDDADAVRFRKLRSERGELLALHGDGSFVGNDRAGATLDEGRFSGAVFPDKGMRFTPDKIDADILQRDDAGVFFGVIRMPVTDGRRDEALFIAT